MQMAFGSCWINSHCPTKRILVSKVAAKLAVINCCQPPLVLPMSLCTPRVLDDWVAGKGASRTFPRPLVRAIPFNAQKATRTFWISLGSCSCCLRHFCALEGSLLLLV